MLLFLIVNKINLFFQYISKRTPIRIADLDISETLYERSILSLPAAPAIVNNIRGFPPSANRSNSSRSA